ncbi:electron transport complex subunit RsxC [Erwinia tasmaniensis]|uniref:Ion-translocating oxidoreductase complex subunit C n=1 Tax=Erwinia tasmaniensis (strain DSM 17950 / CFBP 7177 / CIP 109463 / NCPPB 4357 / Et1/99) TaxID=465817 RepID=RNFC_ERWT9|nr:electron transport complex subunit RsxC [Erwinia tasmaniensis]B2VEQ3.1 RecName: Full=Ion-translocating oxidoreductase complex subunit C; AltName: Full=Rnf electron transport complex subunit C [Erwinia tasmaniensis Et1/99]CAO96822.1 Electron transport complex protein [Erwinia tasmaniensis Et1/99]
MLNLLNLFKKDRLWDFDGGIHPPEMKTQSNGTPLRHLPLPAQFVLPLKQHIGHEGEIGVRPGDQVLRGQPLTFGTGRMLPVHAPTSGTVSKIAPHMTAHPSALAEMCLFILPDGEDRWCEKRPLEDYRSVERSELVARVHQAGVAGLGGAGFPTASKLKGGLHGVNTLIINAAECEPYITADDRLMQDHAAEVLEGSRILAWILQAERVLIGIEDNKPEAIAALKKALGSATDLHIRVIPTKYPSGGAKQLTKILTGKEVPHGGRSTDIGVLMQNVGTAFAVKRAIIDGEPLTERVVTLTGESVAQPGNVWARLGTPISHLLQHAGFIPGAEQMVVMGGPLMGFTLPTLDVPVVKITNCILAPAASEMGQNEAEQGCIRCSACADACPAALLPQQLYWYSRGGDHDKARAHNIADCIECGACAYVCPSNIPLVQYYRQEKAEIQAIDLEAERAALAKNRFEARQQRLEREKAARSAKHQQAKRSVASSDAGAIAAARERVAARQAEGVSPENHADNSLQAAVQAQHEAEVRVHQADLQAANEPVTRQTLDPRKAAVEAAIARTKAKKAAQAAEASPTEAPQQSAPEDEPRKAAVAAAVARTKAKKAAQAAEASPTEAPQQSAPEDVPRKAAVAAAVARAKAKKAAQAAEASATEAPQQSAPEHDPRKAAVAAAVARAKAKKAAQAAEASATEAPLQPAPEDDPRKAAVAAAVARAKAKKAAQAAEASATEAPLQPAPEDDPRKAAVAAAVARAKAKKAAQAAEASATEAPLQPAPEDDPRKAAIAAAIARAKARKTQQPSMQED